MNRRAAMKARYAAQPLPPAPTATPMELRARVRRCREIWQAIKENNALAGGGLQFVALR